MAITNAQQYQQLVNKPANGKRPGYRGDYSYGDSSEKGYDPGGGKASKGSGVSTGSGGYAPTSQAAKGTGGYKAPTYTGGADNYQDVSTNKNNVDIAKKEKKKYQKQFTSKGKAPPGLNQKKRQRALDYVNRGLARYLDRFEEYYDEEDFGITKTGYPNFGFPNFYDAIGDELTARKNIKEIKKTGNKIPVGTSGNSYELSAIPDLDIDSIRELASVQTTKQGAPLTGYQAGALKDLKRNIENRDTFLETGDTSVIYPDPPEATNTGGGDQQTDPCLGPNPPAYCNVGGDDDDDDDTNKRNLGGLAPRLAGSIFNFDGMADGGRAGFKDGEGIMQTASAPDPMDERNSMMETIAMEEFGKPLSDLNEDEIIQIELFMEEMSKRKNEPRVMAQQGGRMMNDDDPTGGIMDLESGRQMYFLGKLVKKATRAVKKVVKSPIGKAALMYFGGNALMGAGGGGGLSSFFKSGKGLGFKDFLTKSFLGPELSGRGNRSGGILGFMKNNPYLSILGGSSILAGLSGKGEDEGEIDYGPGIDINKYRYGNYLAPNFTGYGKADGGRIGYAEGSEEPVAKETMPLIDMDGKEMDLREDGGFVPLGRMERADDVPARLSKNEFVFTADAVRNAGEGDIDKGAEVMYNMMKNLESGGDVSEESQGLDGAREMFQTSQRLEEVL